MTMERIAKEIEIVRAIKDFADWYREQTTYCKLNSEGRSKYVERADPNNKCVDIVAKYIQERAKL